jgi:hypothetical protein
MSTPTDETQPCECDEPDGYCDACEDEHGHTCIICGADFCTPCWETPGHNDHCKRVVMADGSISAALTDEEARGLAKRWATWREYDERMAAFKAGDGPFPVCQEPPLPRADHERLYAWVRSELTQAPTSRTMAARNVYLAERLALTVEQADALRKASGWPS